LQYQVGSNIIKPTEISKRGELKNIKKKKRYQYFPARDFESQPLLLHLSFSYKVEVKLGFIV